MKDEKTMSVTIRKVRKTLVSALDYEARRNGISREKLLLSLLEQEFSFVEEYLIQMTEIADSRGIS